MRLSLLLALIAVFMLGCGGGQLMQSTSKHLHFRNWAYQLQGAEPELIANSHFELVVIDYSRDGTEEGEYSPEEIHKVEEAGVTPLAYLSIGEAEDYRFYWRKEWSSKPPEWLGKENPEWKGNYAVKYWREEWKSILYAYLDRIIAQGFSGVYLDKVDEFEYWSDPDNGEVEHLAREEAAERMIKLIIALSDYARARAGEDFLIIPQNGESILGYDDGKLLSVVSGWAAEDIFYNGIEEWSPGDEEWIREERLPYLKVVLSAGKFVLSVDYVDDGSGYQGDNKRRVDDYIERARRMGFIPYAARADRELDELNIIEGVQP